MKEAQREPIDKEAILSAVRLNWRLWTIFQADLSSPDSEVPPEIRQNMLSLSNFVDKTSVEIISEPDPKRMDILITINREIAMGLFENPPQEADGGDGGGDVPDDGGPPASGIIDASV